MHRHHRHHRDSISIRNPYQTHFPVQVPVPLQGPIGYPTLPIPVPLQGPVGYPTLPIILEPRFIIPVNKFKSLSNINLSSKTINNIGIIFINSNGILFVKNKLLDEWMIPFDKKYNNELNENAISRIFQNNINFEIIQSQIISKDTHIRMHRNGEKSIFYIIRTNQNIPISLTNTDDFIFIPLYDLKQLIKYNISYKQVNNLIDFNKTLFNDLINNI